VGQRERSIRITLADPAATDAFGRALAASCPSDQRVVVYLHGDLGAGKTTLARAWLRGLGVDGPIRSPTYTLVERYRLADGSECAHLDLYRISDPEELDYLALDELASSARLWLVEWPQRGAGRLPAADLSVCLSLAGAGRDCEIEAGSNVGSRCLDKLGKMAN